MENKSFTRLKKGHGFIMIQCRKSLFLGIVFLGLLLCGCSVGTNSLFVHPTEQGYPYAVTYDAMGGHINQMKTRVVYYAEDSLLYQPSGTAGMLVEPKNGQKTLLGWYTAYRKVATDRGDVFEFEEENRWDFSKDRVNNAIAPAEELTLYARWGVNPTVLFVDAENPEGEALLRWSIPLGNVISRPTSTEPVKAGYTLVDYYTDETCTEKYVYGLTITEEDALYDEDGNAYIKIYCKFIEGDYVRIKSISQLQSMKEDTDAFYILANDLDVDNEVWTPIDHFTGEFDGNGYTIKNLTIPVKYRVAGIAAKSAEEESFGLFRSLDGAKISNLTLKDSRIVIDHTSNVSFTAGVLAGRTRNTVLTNCIFDGVVIEATGPLSVDMIFSPTAAGDDTTSWNNCELNNYESPKLTSKGTIDELGGRSAVNN